MTVTATATAPKAAARRSKASDAAGEAHRLMPRPLLVILTVALCALVLVPILYIVLASLNTDIGVASGEIWPSSF
jgi:multiple sugar transport system permease protein